MRTVWIYGPPGVGKSTAAWQLFVSPGSGQRPTAYVDIDQLGMFNPTEHIDSPTADDIKAANLDRVLRTFAEAGACSTIVSGVLDPRRFPVYSRQLTGLEMSYCRLSANEEELRRRGVRRGGSTDQDLDHALLEARRLDDIDLGHPHVATDDISPPEVAQQVASKVDLGAPQPAGAPAWRIPLPATHTRVPSGQMTVVCGPPAVGKSTVAWQLFMRERAQGRSTAFADIDQLGFLRPEPGRPSVRDAVRASNAAGLWRTFAAAGADHLLLNGNVISSDLIDQLRLWAPGIDLRVVRLSADAASLRRRVFQRRHGEGPHLAGDNLKHQPDAVLQRAARDAYTVEEELSATTFSTQVIDTSSRTVDSVVDELEQR